MKYRLEQHEHRVTHLGTWTLSRVSQLSRGPAKVTVPLGRIHSNPKAPAIMSFDPKPHLKGHGT